MRVTANQVTRLRLLAMPLVGWLVYGSPTTQAIGVAIGTLIGLTDTVDGYLARKYGPTVLGSLLDPVADKIFIVVCYGCFADRGGIPWWIAAAIFSRELLVTVLRSSLELGGRRLPSTGIAKVKTWVQMIAFGFLVLIPIIGSGRGLQILFAAPLAFALLVLASRRASGIAPARLPDRRGGAGAVPGHVLRRRRGDRAAADWRGRLHHLVERRSTTSSRGSRRSPARRSHRALHWLRLGAGALLPVVVMAALATHRLPTIPLVILLASDMARGALDNFAANQGVADFSWAASMWGELGLLAAALAFPPAGSYLCLVAAVVAVAETLRSLVKYLRAPCGGARGGQRAFLRP